MGRTLIGAAVLVLGLVPVARAATVTPADDCTIGERDDRSTPVLTPGTTLNQVSVWLSADADADEIGIHLEPWHREAYYVDAAVGPDGTSAADASVDGDDGEGPSYGRIHANEQEACAASATAGAGVAAATDQTVVAGPGAFSAGYLTRTATIAQGAGLDFLNGDVAGHDVRSYDTDDQGRALFASDLVGTATATPVDGVEDLAPGSYEFFCSAHPNMIGTLTVQGTP